MVPNLITDDMNQWLCCFPFEAEVAGVVSSLVSGPNGFNEGFLKRYWDVMSIDVLALIHDIFNGHGSMKHINRTFIMLIPKFPGASSIRDF